ncbi:MAG: hypothetical protein ACLU6O_11230 [Bilophila wadsworthia]
MEMHESLSDFFGYQAAKGRKKGREPKTVRERREYSPKGSCIIPLAAMNSRKRAMLFRCMDASKNAILEALASLL